MRITGLYVYPVKSLGAVAVREAQAGDLGLEGDRRWMLVDADGRFLTQREHATLALGRVALGSVAAGTVKAGDATSGAVTLSAPGLPPLCVTPPPPNGWRGSRTAAAAPRQRSGRRDRAVG